MTRSRKHDIELAVGYDYYGRSKKIRMSTLERNVKIMEQEAKRRYNALKKRGMTGSATKRYEKSLSGEMKDSSRKSLLRRAEKLQYFLSLKTSTVKGYRASAKQAEDFFGKVERVGMSDAEQKSFWEAWDKMKQNPALQVWKAGSDLIMDKIITIIREDRRIKKGSTIVSKLTKSYAQAKAEKIMDLWEQKSFITLK